MPRLWRKQFGSKLCTECLRYMFYCASVANGCLCTYHLSSNSIQNVAYSDMLHHVEI